MKKEIAQNALIFLSRAQLNGKEAQAMTEVIQVISSFIPKEELKEGEKEKKDSK